MNIGPIVILTLWLIAASTLWGEAPETKKSSAEKSKPAVTTLPGWGEVVDLAKDCQFKATGKDLVMLVPGSDRPHDFSAELGNIDAPRVLLPQTGDFTMEVKVDGSFSPGAESTQPSRTGYMGAGLVVMADDNSYVLLMRASLEAGTRGPIPYINFEIRENGRIVSFGSTRDYKTPTDGPVWLRIQRKGQVMHGAVRQEGEEWADLKPMQLPADWPKALKAGVNAVSTSKQVFSPKFSDLKVTTASAKPTP